MKIKATGLLVAIVLMMSAMALPASAVVSVGPHAGAFVGTADVGKDGTCANDGIGTVSGGGIGLVPTPAKNAWYRITAGLVVDAPNGLGSADLCGRLTAPLQGTVDLKSLGIGASCIATKGWGGYGKAVIGGQEIWISNLGWKATLGGTFLVTGDVGGVKGKKADLLVAQVQALSEGVLLGCINKSLGDKGDPDPFTVVATYEIVPGAGGTVPKKAPKK